MGTAGGITVSGLKSRTRRLSWLFFVHTHQPPPPHFAVETIYRCMSPSTQKEEHHICLGTPLLASVQGLRPEVWGWHSQLHVGLGYCTAL